MPFWVPFYVMLLAVGGLGSFFFGRDYLPRQLRVLDLAVAVALALFVLAFYEPGLIDHRGRGVALLYVLTLAAIGVAHHWEVSILPRFPDWTQHEHRPAILFAVIELVVYAPGLGLGALVALRTWSG